MNTPVRPITMQEVTNRPRPVRGVDIVIEAVNQALRNPSRSGSYLCSPSLGKFYQVTGDLSLTAAECLELDAAFRKALWKDVQVIYYEKRWSISLAADHFRHWQPYFNGKLIPIDVSQKVEAVQ